MFWKRGGALLKIRAVKRRRLKGQTYLMEKDGEKDIGRQKRMSCAGQERYVGKRKKKKKKKKKKKTRAGGLSVLFTRL